MLTNFKIDFEFHVFIPISHLDTYKPDNNNIQGEKTIKIDLNQVDDDYLKANTINGQIVTPISSCLNKAYDTLKNWQTSDTKEALNVVFDDIKIYKPLLTIPEDNIVKVLVAVLKGLLNSYFFAH